MIPNLIVLITGLIGFVTAGLILKNHKSNNVMNIYIILIIIAVSLRFFLLGSLHFIPEESFKQYCIKYSNFPIIVFPLFYLYVKNLSNKSIRFEKKELLHFIFPIFFIIILMNINSFKIYLKSIRYVLYFIFFLYLVFYSIMTYRLLKRNIWLKKDTIKIVKKQNILNSSWTYYLFIANLFIVIRLLGSLFLELHYGSISRGFSYLWVSAFVWLLVLIKLLVSPEILYGYDFLHKKVDENRNKNLVLNSIWNTGSKKQIKNKQHLLLKEKIEPNILTYIEEIEKISFTDKIFRDQTITMEDLANKLKMPKSHVSYLFKYHSTISFSEYKKVVRIQDAINLINENYLKENTLDYLSKKVGFPSYNTFFTSFKDISGSSPLEYCKTDRR